MPLNDQELEVIPADSFKTTCAIVCPISSFAYNGQEYSKEFWDTLQNTVSDWVKEIGYEPVKVWETQNNEMILQRIISNLFRCKLCVCVAIGLNPNVMFELGMRVAWQKPITILSDANTQLPFDVKYIKSIFYPSRNETPEALKKCQKEFQDELQAAARGDRCAFLKNLDFQVDDEQGNIPPWLSSIHNSLIEIAFLMNMGVPDENQEEVLSRLEKLIDKLVNNPKIKSKYEEKYSQKLKREAEKMQTRLMCHKIKTVGGLK